MIRTVIAITVACMLATPPVRAGAEATQERPKIGLALSGGGARGGAHVGVLRKLDELGVPIDFVAGTSMGAIVGALYSAGFSPDEIEALFRDTDWRSAFTDRPSRQDETMRQKDLDQRLLIPYRIGFNHGSFQFPMGAVEGQHLDQMFNRLLFPVVDVQDFDDLPIPFRAVATNLETGGEVVIGKGSLPDAIRASMSVPGFFAPVPLDGQLLVDGGMSNNLPVSVVREMGADIVIAVDISTPLLTADELTSVLAVSEQLTTFLTRKNTEDQIAILQPQDILLVPDLVGFSSADFKEAAEMSSVGYKAANKHEAALAQLANPAGATRLGPAQEEPGQTVIEFITLNNQSVLDDEIILSRIESQPGEVLDIDRLERNIDQIYSLDVFQSVTYSVAQNPAGQKGLYIDAQPRSWGPNYLQAGLEFSDDFSGNSQFQLAAAYTRNALNPYGGELRVTGGFGREDVLDFNFYQPIDKGARWFVEVDAYYRRYRFNIYLDKQLASQLEIAGSGAVIGIGRNLDYNNQLRLDYNYFRGDADELLLDQGFLVDDNVEIGELVLSYQHDTLDSVYFPTEGAAITLAYSYGSEALGAGLDYDQAIFQGTKSWSFGRNIILAHGEAGYSFDDLTPQERLFQLGGFARLSGLIPDELNGRNLGLLTMSYMRELGSFDLAPVYAGLTAEAGNVWLLKEDVSLDDLQYAGSVFIGAETPIGPVYLAWGYHESGDSTIYFYVGNPYGFRRF
jgi:NTE family protein